jgi:hypothetical protein
MVHIVNDRTRVERDVSTLTAMFTTYLHNVRVRAQRVPPVGRWLSTIRAEGVFDCSGGGGRLVSFRLVAYTVRRCYTTRTVRRTFARAGSSSLARSFFDRVTDAVLHLCDVWYTLSWCEYLCVHWYYDFSVAFTVHMVHTWFFFFFLISGRCIIKHRDPTAILVRVIHVYI